MSQWLADTYERAIFWLLVVQYVFVNLIFTTYTQNIVMLKDLSAPLISILVFALWVCGDLAKHGRWVLPRHGVVPPMVACLLWWAVSVIEGTSPATGVELWGRMWGYFVQVWAILRFIDTYRLLGLFLRFILLTNVLAVFYGQTQLMGVDFLVELGLIPDWGSSVFVSTHGNPNFYAGYLIATFPIIVGYWLVTRNPVLILALPVVILLNLYHVVESTARGAYLAVAIYAPLFGLALFLNRRNLHFMEEPLRRKLLKVTAALLVVATLGSSVVFFEKVSSFSRKVYGQFYSLVDFEGNYTNWVRLVFFQMALDGAVRHPYLGRGMASYNWHMPETRPVWYHRTGVSHNTDHPHNEHLEWLHDTGVVGLAVFWWMLAAYVATGVREIWRHRNGYFFPVVIGAFAGPLMQWVQATFDVETRWTGNGVTMWTTFGIALAFCNLAVIRRREEVEPVAAAVQVQSASAGARRRSAARPAATAGGGKTAVPVARLADSPYLPYAAAALGLCIVFYGIQSWRFWRADHHLRNNMAFTDGNAGSAQMAINEAEMARRYNYTSTSNYYKLAYSYLVAGRLQDALQAYRDLQSFAPNYAQIHINLAYLNDQIGYRPASAWERSRAAAIEHNTRNHRDAAQYWLSLGYPSRAIGHLRKCFTINVDRTEAGYWYWYDRDNVHADLSRVYASIGDRAAAQEELKRALRFNPNNMSAALLLTQLLMEGGDRGEADSLIALLKRYAPSNPALIVMDMTTAVGNRDFAKALSLADSVASTLSIPAGAPAQEAGMLGNAILGAVQSIYAAGHDQARCLEVAGWIYAAQGRYQEAENLLAQAYNVTRNPQTAQRLGQVRSRLQSGA